MRVYASLGALASIAWLSSAAAVPRAEDWGVLTDTTCTSKTADQATVIILPGQSATSYATPTVFTFTLPANGGTGSPAGPAETLSGIIGSSSDLANGPSFVSSTCTSPETPLVPGDSSGPSGLVTVTVPSLPTPSAPTVSTVTVPVLTVTVPSPALSPDNSIATVTVQQASSGPASEATAPPVVTATVPGVGASSSVGVITVTIPEGPSDTATVVLTVTVPQGSGSPGAWSTIITAPGISGASTGPLVTVTIFTSPVTAVPTGPSAPPLDWSSESTALITVPLGTGYGSDSLLAPYTLTYTLPAAPGLTALSVATLTITPLDLSIPTGVGPFATATLSSGVSSWSYVPSAEGTSLVSFTVPASGTVPAYTGVITVTPGMSWGTPTPVITGQSGIATITAPEVTVTVPSSPGQVGGSSGVVTVTVASPTDSISLPTPSSPGDQSGVVTVSVPIALSSAQPPFGSIVTVTVPQGTGPGPAVFTLTISQPTGSAFPSSNVGNSGSIGTWSVPVSTVTAADTTVIVTPDFGSPSGTSTTPPSVVTVTNTPSSPANTDAGAQTLSIVAVTYTAPASLGGPASEYTVMYTLSPSDSLASETSFNTAPGGYGNGGGGSWSAPFSSQTSQVPDVETVTVWSGSAGSPGGPSPWTFTIIPTNGFDTPVVVTYTPSLTDLSTRGSAQPGFVTVTVTPDAAQSSGIVSVPSGVVTVTYTPSASYSGQTSSAQAGVVTVTEGVSSDTGVIVTTIAPLSGSPVVLTLLSTGSPLTPLNSPSWATQTDATPAVSLVTISPVSGTPFVVTITPGSGISTATTSQIGVVTVTQAPSGLVTESIVSDSVITVTPPSAPPFVVTIPGSVAQGWSSTSVGSDSTGGAGVVTVIPESGYPEIETLSVNQGTASSAQPGVVTVIEAPTSTLNAGSGGSIFTATPSSGSPVFLTLPGGSGIFSLSTNSPSPSVLTVTPASGAPIVVTIPAGSNVFSLSTISPSPSILTVTPASGSPVVVTIPSDSNSTPISAGQPGGVTISQGESSTTGPGGSVITVTPVLGSPYVVTIFYSAYGGGGSAPTHGASSAAIFTVTAPQQTVIVSQVTISQTIALGAGSSTVVAITTQVTLPADSTPAPASSAVLVTPSPVTYTIADSYGNPTTLTSWTYLPVSPSDSGAGLGGVLSSATETAQFITILPSNSASVITILPSAAPSVITIWPSTNTLVTSFLSSSSCTAKDPGATISADPDQAQSASASPSEITLWPLPTSVDTTCTTFSTSYRSSRNFDPGAATSESSFSVITLWPSTSSPPYSVITIWPSSVDSALAGSLATSTCTETTAASTSVILLSSVSTPFTTFPTTSASQGGESSILVVPTETAEAPISQGSDTLASALPESTELPPLQPENTESPPAQPENTEAPVSSSEDLIPPPQTEFNRHGQHARTTLVALSDSTFGGYAFSSSAAGYGGLPPGYGNPVATIPVLSSEPILFTDSNLPVSQPASVTVPVASTTSSADLTSLLSSIMSVLSANATFVSGPGPVLTSIPAASSNNTATGSLETLTTSLEASTASLESLTALPTTASTFLVNLSSLTAAPIATSLASLSLNATAVATLSSNGTALSFINSVSVASSSTPVPTLSSRSPENLTLSSTSSRGLPASTCGAVGDRGAVVFKFDDIPTITTDNDTEASSFPAMPVPFPYHRFFFSNGFSVVPPPRTKFKPSSGDQLIQHNSSVSPVAEFGLAQLRSNPCFQFSFLGVSLGCDSTNDPCVFNITGLRWNGTDDVVEARHTFEVAACSKKTDCSLSHQILNSAAELPFSNLTSLNISLTVAGKPETWWADDLQIAWADNDCTAAACRSLVPNTIMIPHKPQTFTTRAKRLLRWAVRGIDDELY